MTDPATDWAGDKGRFWAEHADWFSALLADFAPVVVDGAEFAAGERVLDVGCGGGDLTMAAAGAVGPSGSALGVDLSNDELDVAWRRAAERGVANVEFRQADAGRDDLGPTPVDVCCSRFGVMFFPDPVAAFAHIRAALRPGGRLAFVCWKDPTENPWITVPGAALAEVLPLAETPPSDDPGGFSFRDPDRVRSVLDAAGFTAVDVDDAHRSVHLGASAEEAVAFVRTMDYAKAVLDSAPPEVAGEAISRATAALAAHAGADGIELPGRAWLVRAQA